jgi:regulator of ribonuclease activity A
MWTTADLMDEGWMAATSCDQPLLQYGGLREFAGVVRTVRCLEDVSLIRSLLETDGAGRVLVVDGGGSLRSALMGDHMAGTALANGWAGVVLHGAVRDVRELGTLRLGVKALGSNPRRSGRCEPGEVDVPVTFGNVTFRPGDYVVSDDDGIAVLHGAERPPTS